MDEDWRKCRDDVDDLRRNGKVMEDDGGRSWEMTGGVKEKTNLSLNFTNENRFRIQNPNVTYEQSPFIETLNASTLEDR